MTFKSKEGAYDILAIKHLAKFFGIPINVKAIMEKGFKDKSVAAPIKEKLLYYLWTAMNSENDFDIKYNFKKGYSKTFKYFVGKGNSSQLLKAIMNQRYWWQVHPRTDMNELNFLWTEWKTNSEIDKLSSRLPKPVKYKLDESLSVDSEDEEAEGEDSKIVPSTKYMQVI